MNDAAIHDALASGIPANRVARNVALAPWTTFKVGGAADWLVEARDTAEVRHACAVAREAGLPVVPLGGGSNVLVADAGVRGIVLRVHGGEAGAVSDSLVRAGAGLTINGLVRWTIGRGYAGLEAWAGTPGTVGGALHGNAHFRGRSIGDLVQSVELLDAWGGVLRVAHDDMAFAYGFSRLRQTNEVVISADFRVSRGDPVALRTIARESLAFRKRTQPLESASAGCVFQNPDPARDLLPPDVPPSAGALIDRAGLKGAREGGARVSTTHGNFIVNEGGATSADIARLIERCRTMVRARFGVELRDEIIYLGF